MILAGRVEHALNVSVQCPHDTDARKNRRTDQQANSGGRPRFEGKVSHLIGFSSSLYGRLDGKFLELSMNMLGGELKEHLMCEVPKEKFPTTPEWVQAVKREVDEVLLPRARAEMDSPDHLAAKAAEFITTDRIIEDLTLEELLDAMVDRAMRRLAQVKFMKQISGSSERLLKNAPTLQIEGPRRSRRQMDKK